MSIRLYLDEDAMSEGLVLALRSKGVDVITTTEAVLPAPLMNSNYNMQLRKIAFFIATTEQTSMLSIRATLTRDYRTQE